MAVGADGANVGIADVMANTAESHFTLHRGNGTDEMVYVFTILSQ